MIDLDKVKPGDMLGVRVTRVVDNYIGVKVSRPLSHDYGIPAGCLHPLSPDPRAGLRDAVVEDARAAVTDYHMRGGYSRYVESMDVLCRSVDALNAAMKPPDPIAELLAASRAAVVLTGYCYDDRERLRAAIAAVEAMGRV